MCDCVVHSLWVCVECSCCEHFRQTRVVWYDRFVIGHSEVWLLWCMYGCVFGYRNVSLRLICNYATRRGIEWVKIWMIANNIVCCALRLNSTAHWYTEYRTTKMFTGQSHRCPVFKPCRSGWFAAIGISWVLSLGPVAINCACQTWPEALGLLFTHLSDCERHLYQLNNPAIQSAVRAAELSG